MVISIKCPRCGQQYNLRNELADKRCKCRCGHAFVVPKPAPGTEAADFGDDSESDRLSDLFDEALPLAAGGPAPCESIGGDFAEAASERVLRAVKPRAKRSSPNTLVIGAIVGGSAVAVLLIGLTIFMMAGSGGSDGTAASNGAAGQADSDAKELGGFATPEEAFDAFKKAMLAKDWASHLAVHTPESQERIVGGLAYTAIMFSQFSDSKPEITELLKKHGVGESMLKAQPSDMRPGDFKEMFQKIQQQQRQLAAAVKDKSTFYIEMMALLEKGGTEWAEKLPGMSSSPGKNAEQAREEAERARAEAKLVDVQISGDTAEGKQALPWRGRTMNLPVYFRRIDGRWYIHQPGMAEAMEMGKQIGQSIAQRMAKEDQTAGQEGSPRLEIKARIDGQEKVYIHSDRIQWEHVSWSWPTKVTINGAQWDPQKTQTFNLEAGLRTAMRNVNFRSARIEQTKGRNAVLLAKSDVHLMVIFDDHQPGADDYQVAIFFED